jgi:hypothetical protein
MNMAASRNEDAGFGEITQVTAMPKRNIVGERVRFLRHKSQLDFAGQTGKVVGVAVPDDVFIVELDRPMGKTKAIVAFFEALEVLWPGEFTYTVPSLEHGEYPSVATTGNALTLKFGPDDMHTVLLGDQAQAMQLAREIVKFGQECIESENSHHDRRSSRRDDRRDD